MEENNERIIELDNQKIENLDNDINRLNYEKKYKISKKINVILSVFLCILLTFTIVSVILISIIFNRIKPFFRGILGNNVNIASVSQMTKDKAIDMQNFSNKLAFLDDIINMFYYYDKDNKRIEDMMFTGYMKGLDDKYAEYFPAKVFEEFTETTTEGVYYGIGCQVKQDKNNSCVVQSVYSNSPAEKGGIKVDDVIVGIDGENVKGINLNDIVDKIKGTEGTEKKITVYRPSENKEIELTCYCGKVDIELITAKVLEDNLGFIRIDSFTGKAYQQFKNSIDELVDKNIKGLIIDCRNNPGGELNTVYQMIDYLVKDRDSRYTLDNENFFEIGKALLVYIKEKDKIVDAKYAEDKHSVELPMIVLTDGGTASAAELFTSVLRDYKKADIVGARTYGKGVVQTVIPYDDGSAFKFTVSEYFPPSGYSINMKGIMPNYVLDYNGDELIYDKDNNLIIESNGDKYTFDREGNILSKVRIATISEISTKSDTNKISHTENYKIYDNQNTFLNEDWYSNLYGKYEDKQLLQAIVVLKNKIK